MRRLTLLIALVLALLVPTTQMTAAGAELPSARSFTSAASKSFTPKSITRGGRSSGAAGSHARIGDELVAARSRTARTFVSDRGYETVIYAGSVNYQDSRGQWQPIDDTLVASSAAGGSYQNKANAYRVRFPQDLERAPVHFALAGNWVEFSLDGAHGTLSASQQTASYPNVLPHVNLSLTAQADALKEALVLQAPDAPHTFTYDIRTSPGLTARANNSGAIDFIDSAGSVPFKFAPPVMYDSSGRAAGTSRSVTMTISHAGQVLTVAADSGWLSRPERKYPVVVDPTIWTNVNYYGGQDCYLQNTNPTSSFCSSGTYTGTTDAVGYDGTSVNRALSLFPIQTGYTHIVPNSNILDADLTLTLSSSSVTTAVPVSVQPLTQSWTSSATWNTSDGTTAWTTAGGTFGSALDTENIGPASGAYKWHGLTQTIQNWVNGTSTNQGFLLKAATETTVGLLQFDNHNYGTSSTDPNRPHLRVQWNNWLGEQPWYKFVSRELTDRMVLKVNVANGNLVIHSMDLAIKGTGLDLHVDRYYGSLSGDSWHIGNGWNVNVGCDIRLDLDDWDGISYHEPDGYAVLFRSNGSGGWTSAPALDADLVKNADATYSLTWHATGEKFDFQTGGCFQDMVDSKGNKITMSYNGQLQSITDTQSRATSFTYGSTVSSSLITQIKDPSGRLFNYAYDTSKNLVSYTDPNNGVTKYAYNANGQLSQITDPNSNVTNFSYGPTYPYPVTQVQYVSSTCPNSLCTTSFTYNSGNTVVSDGNGNKTTYAYDNQGRVTQVTDALGNNPTMASTSDNSVQRYTDQAGATTSLSWDGKNNLTGLTVPTGGQATLAYGDAAHLYYPTSTTDPEGNTTGYTYDANGNVTSTTDALPSQNQLKATYNTNGTVASITDGLGNTTTYSYDQFGNPAGMTRPAPLGAVSFTYDGLSRLSSLTDGKGQKTNFTYDALDHKTGITYADVSSITYSYDADGNLTSMVDNTGTTSFSYDALNEMLKKTLPNGSTVSYSYDPAGNLSSIADAGGTVSYGYNAVNLVTSMTEPNAAKTTFGYDANYNRTSTTYPNGVTMSASYDASGRLTSIVAKKSTGVTLTSFTYSYTNPSTGKDTDLRYSVTDASGNKTVYTYDVLNRLTEAKATSGAGTVTSDYQFTYDGNGNRLTQTVNGSITSYAYNSANELCWSFSGSSTTGCATPPTGSTTYTFDGNGNETVSGSLNFSYNAKDQTSSITPTSSSAVNMTYTGATQTDRVSAGAGSYTYSQLGLAIESQPAGTTYYTRDSSGTLTEERTPSGNYYYVFDGLGSTVALTDSNGNVVDTFQFDPYGQVAASTGTVPNPWLFAGVYYDSGTKLYKMGARYYDPAVGRFTQEDPARDGLNLYAYAQDNPVIYTDPTGQWLWVAVGAVVGGIAGGALYAWNHRHEKGILTKMWTRPGFWAHVGAGALIGAGAGFLLSPSAASTGYMLGGRLALFTSRQTIAGGAWRTGAGAVYRAMLHWRHGIHLQLEGWGDDIIRLGSHSGPQ